MAWRRFARAGLTCSAVFLTATSPIEVPLCGIGHWVPMLDGRLILPIYDVGHSIQIELPPQPAIPTNPRTNLVAAYPIVLRFWQKHYSNNTETYIAVRGFGIRGEDGRPKMLRQLRLDCGRGLSLVSTEVARYSEEEQIYRGRDMGTGFGSRINRASACLASIRANDKIRLIYSIGEVGAATATFQVKVPLNRYMSHAEAILCEELRKANVGECRVPPVPLPSV